MSSEAEARVGELVQRFRQLGETRMRGLPLYHDALEVEAVGFDRCGDAVVGALITPWFLNVVHLPLRSVSVDWSAIGQKVEHDLPGGRFTFTRGGDEALGRYDAISLRSPVFAFASQERARHEARRRLAPLLTAPEATGGLADPARRAFLAGRTRGA